MKQLQMLTYLGVLAVFISSVNALTGDLDLDGDVDFDDFFLLADNFGKKGDITDVCGNEIVPPSETGELVGTINGLAYIDTGFLLAQNWDADIEDDGLEVAYYLRDSQGDFIFSRDISSWVVFKINIRFFTSTGAFSDKKLSEAPFFDRDFIVKAEDVGDELRIPFEEYVSKIPSTRSTSSNGNLNAIVELRLVQSDGTVFAAQKSASLPLE
jgi:hypothetical protein